MFKKKDLCIFIFFLFCFQIDSALSLAIYSDFKDLLIQIKTTVAQNNLQPCFNENNFRDNESYLDRKANLKDLFSQVDAFPQKIKKFYFEKKHGLYPFFCIVFMPAFNLGLLFLGTFSWIPFIYWTFKDIRYWKTQHQRRFFRVICLLSSLVWIMVMIAFFYWSSFFSFIISNEWILSFFSIMSWLNFYNMVVTLSICFCTLVAFLFDFFDNLLFVSMSPNDCRSDIDNLDDDHGLIASMKTVLSQFDNKNSPYAQSLQLCFDEIKEILKNDQNALLFQLSNTDTSSNKETRMLYKVISLEAQMTHSLLSIHFFSISIKRLGNLIADTAEISKKKDIIQNSHLAYKIEDFYFHLKEYLSLRKKIKKILKKTDKFGFNQKVIDFLKKHESLIPDDDHLKKHLNQDLDVLLTSLGNLFLSA